MEKKLYDAAVEGDVNTLHRLLQEDPLLLDKVTLDCQDKNPLHIAAMLGHVDFIKAILQLNNISSFFYMCLARDRDGRNPLQLAAMYGKLAALEVLIHGGFQAALEKTDGGGTTLHLCVKYNQLDALKMLLSTPKDPEFVNAKDDDGRTILHLAIYYKQHQTIQYLLDEIGGENIKNAKGKTALDLLLAQGEINSDILSSLKVSEALKGKDFRNLTKEIFEKKRNAVMVVASLIATMAFQAGVSPPGGVWQDDLLEGPNPHRVGEAVMAQTHPKHYRHLVRATTIAFVSCSSTIVLLIRGWRIPKRIYAVLMTCVMWLAIATIAITYAIALVTISPKDTRSQLSGAGEIALIVLVVLSGFIVLLIYGSYFAFKKQRKIRRMHKAYLMADRQAQSYTVDE